MKRIKRVGRELFVPELGGSFEVFKQRPLDARVLQYCGLDVYFSTK
jgi:exonuclease 3'-5' domain-containing protein 1